MKRLLKSALGGVFIPLALVAPLFILANCCRSLLERLDKIPPLVSIGRIYLGLFLFPVFILPAGPKSDSPDPNAPMIRVLLLISTILIDFVVYSALTYAILTWRARRKTRA